MSKEFEEWKEAKLDQSGVIYCEDAFTAGRTLGRREMKGEAQLIAISASRMAESVGQMADENTPSRDRMFARSREASDIADAIEAIPEEVGEAE